MIMKKLFVISALSVIVLSLVGCKSEEEKALDAAIASQELSSLRSFYSQYGDKLNETLKNKYDATLDRFVQDSTLFDSIENSNSVLERYAAINNYISAFPEGIYFSQVKEMLSECKDQAETNLRRLETIRKAFKNYQFIELSHYVVEYWENLYQSTGGYSVTNTKLTDRYQFTEPDEFGKGDVIISASSFDTFVDWGTRKATVDRECSGSYYVNDDMKIILTVTENRSYSLNWKGKDAAEDKNLLQELKEHNPVPKPRKLTLVLDNKGSFPTLYGKESNKQYTIFFDTIVE